MERPKNIIPMIKAALFFLRIITPSLRFEIFHLTDYIFLMSTEPWRREAHDPPANHEKGRWPWQRLKALWSW